MKIVQFLALAFIWIVISLNVYAQSESSSAKSLVVGEQIPEGLIVDVVNYSSKQINLSDLKGKLVILDWWATTCGSCIAEMPKMEEMQQKFGDRIVILPVSRESGDIIKKFWKSNHKLNKLNLPSGVNAWNLFQYFPHSALPLEIWIDPSGKFIGQTRSEYVNEKEIADVLAGKLKNWPEYRKGDYDFKTPYLTVRDTRMWKTEKGIYYTAFYPHMTKAKRNPGYKLLVDSLNGYMKYRATNMDLVSLYVFLTQQNFTSNMKFINVKDSSAYFMSHMKGYWSEWEEEHTYCMEAVLPLGIKIEDMYRKFIADLNMNFKLNVRIEKREMDCLVIKFKPGSSGPTGKETPLSKKNSFSNLLDVMNGFNDVHGNPYLIDETSFGSNHLKSKICIDDPGDAKEVSAELERLGFIVVPAKRMLDVFCLDELN